MTLNYTTLGLGADFESFGFDVSYVMGGELDPHSDMIRFSLSGSFIISVNLKGSSKNEANTILYLNSIV